MTRRLIVHTEGWLVDYDAYDWVQMPDHPNMVIYTDAKGWPYIPVEATPAMAEAEEVVEEEVEEAPAHTKRQNLAGDWGWYATTYWTHHDWDPDVEELVMRYESEFEGIYLNTYYCHPPVYGRTYEFRSFDVWDSAGRGQALDPTLGDAVFDRIFHDPYGPPIAWIIYKGQMWTPWGWEVYDPPEDGSDPGHYRHIHVTYAV